MNLESLKIKLKVGVYISLSLIVAIIVVRILLKLLGANEESLFAIFWYDLSYYFVGIFDGIYPVIEPAASNLVFETHSVVAVIVYTLLAGILSKSLTSISATSAVDRAKEILDVMFKLIEFFLCFRFILKLTGASTVSSFVQFIYSVSDIVYKPFTGLLPTFEFGTRGQFVLEISTLIAIVIVVFFDVVSDMLITTIKKTSVPPVAPAKSDPPVIPPHEQTLAQPVVPPAVPTSNISQNPQPPVQYPDVPQQGPNDMNQGNSQPYGQSFNFNVGQSPVVPDQQEPKQPSYFDQRSVNVYPNSSTDSTSSINNIPTDNSNAMLDENRPQQLPDNNPQV